MPATRAQWSANGNGSNQITFGDGLTNTVVNGDIHETDENEPQIQKNDGSNRVFLPVD